MLKKIFLSICAIVVIAYLSLWAWAVHWIDEDKNIVDFVSEDKNTTLELAKTVWQITPAINREKDAQRLLKISELSICADLQHSISNLKKNYNIISKYHKKHENKLNEQLKSRFILQKLIFMNRALLKIEDKEFEKEIANMIANHSFYGKDNLETRIEWLPEFIWFIFWHQNTIYDNTYGDILEKYTNYFSDDLISMDKKYNYERAFLNIYSYNHGSLSCYQYYMTQDNLLQNTEKQLQLLELDNFGKKIFKFLQQRITQNREDYEILNKWTEKNSNALFIFQIKHFDSEFECKKEAMNFLSKMEKSANNFR